MTVLLRKYIQYGLYTLSLVTTKYLHCFKNSQWSEKLCHRNTETQYVPPREGRRERGRYVREQGVWSKKFLKYKKIGGREGKVKLIVYHKGRTRLPFLPFKLCLNDPPTHRSSRVLRFHNNLSFDFRMRDHDDNMLRISIPCNSIESYSSHTI